MIITKMILEKNIAEFLAILKESGISDASKYEVLDPNEKSILIQFSVDMRTKIQKVKLLGMRRIGKLEKII